MRFKYTNFSRENRFAIGIDLKSKKYFISIPVNIGLVDDQEYYEITEDEFNCFEKNKSYFIELAEKCRNRQNDAHLIYQPGKARGNPT
jgi:hypothetical protein